jgi:hypothetical protein
MGREAVLWETGKTLPADGTDRPEGTAPLFRYTAKVSRQVLRFFKHCVPHPQAETGHAVVFSGGIPAR